MVTSAAIIELDAVIEMRDGVTLYADIYRRTSTASVR